MSPARYEVVWEKGRALLVPHECTVGVCHPDDPDHGMTFNVARQFIIEELEADVEDWRNATEEEFPG